MSDQRLYLLHALAPLHVGVDEGLGAVELPTMREAHTRYPVVPGSSVKGVFREAAELAHGPDAKKVLAAFGPPQASSSDFRGGVVFTDGQIFALPVRSLCGTFAWVTCPQVLRRFVRDLKVTALGGLAVPAVASASEALVPDTSSALTVAGNGAGPRVFVEDILLDAKVEAGVATLADRVGAWLWSDSGSQEFFRARLLVVHDDVFGFLTEVAMEVRARVKIDQETGTAAGSGPWTEEHLPAEAILHGLVMGRKTTVKERKEGKGDGSQPAEDVGETWDAAKSLEVVSGLVGEGLLLRFGGHSSIGLGRARVRLAAPAPTATQGGRS